MHDLINDFECILANIPEISYWNGDNLPRNHCHPLNPPSPKKISIKLLFFQSIHFTNFSLVLKNFHQSSFPQAETKSSAKMYLLNIDYEILCLENMRKAGINLPRIQIVAQINKKEIRKEISEIEIDIF